MLKIFERTVRMVNDVLLMPRELNDLAQKYEGEGCWVERGWLGIVVIKLEDGEIHIIPSGNKIREMGFKY